MGPFESKGSSPLRSKFTISWPFSTVNVVGGGKGAEGREGGGGAGNRSDPFCSGNVCEQNGSVFFAFGPSNQKLFAFNREKR